MGVQAAATQAHRVSDLNLTVVTALPVAGGTATSTAIDTGDNTDGFFPEGVELHLTTPATTALVSGETIVYTVLADTANPPTTALSPSLTFTTTGTAGNGAAVDVRWRVPGNCGRYLSVRAVAGTTGNNSAVSYTVKLEGAGTPA